MPRHVQSDTAIGDRIKERRKLMYPSIRQAAEAAGMSHSTWSRIERGLVSADNRFVLADIATALRCPVADLAGVRAVPDEREAAGVGAAVQDVINAVTEADPEFPSTLTGNVMPVDALRERVALAQDLRVQCRYLEVARLVPDAVRHLHAHLDGPGRADALPLLVRANEIAAHVVRYVGRDVQQMALLAERMRDAARLSGDPVLLAFSLFTLAHSHLVCGRYAMARIVTDRALAGLRPHLDARGAMEVYGQLCLSTAFSLRGQGDADGAASYLAEADELGARTGDTTTLGLMFGPTNTLVWKVSMETDGGDPGKAVALARTVRIGDLKSQSRQTAFYTDAGRAAARIGQHDSAVRLIHAAEELAPGRVHADPLVREAVRNMLGEQQRRGVPSTLRGLAERVGVGV